MAFLVVFFYFFSFLRTEANNEMGRWLKIYQTQSFFSTKMKGTMQTSALKNNFHYIISILSSFP